MSSAGDRAINEKANKRAKQKAGRQRRAGSSDGVTWDGANWYALIALTAALSRQGGAIRLGKTRDGGAYALGIYLGDDYATEYVRAAEDFTEAIHEIVEAWIPEEQDAYEAHLDQLQG